MLGQSLLDGKETEAKQILEQIISSLMENVTNTHCHKESANY